MQVLLELYADSVRKTRRQYSIFFATTLPLSSDHVIFQKIDFSLEDLRRFAFNKILNYINGILNISSFI